MEKNKQIDKADSQNLFFIANKNFSESSFGKLHPLSGQRVSAVIELCISMDWLSRKAIVNSTAASHKTLSRFHDTAYIDAIKQADDAGMVKPDIREKYNLGTMENPLFKGLFERAATTVGGSQLAANLVANGGIAYHPSGGTHHGRPDRASGFCYFNDPVFAILAFLDQGLDRIAYVDLDAHHGDGVQDAFDSNDKVWTFSIHEDDRWPHTGPVSDHGGGRSFNLPVPQGINDSEFTYLLENVIHTKLREIKPQAIVITLGADGLAADPLSKMCLSNSTLWHGVSQLTTLSPRTVVLGGGGYNPWTTIRCWAGLWGHMIGADTSTPLNEQATSIMIELESDLVDEDEIENIWLTSMVDPPKKGPVREEITNLALRALATPCS